MAGLRGLVRRWRDEGVTFIRAGRATGLAPILIRAAYLAKVEKMGGKTIVPRTEVPGQVIFALFADPEGHVIGLSQGM